MTAAERRDTLRHVIDCVFVRRGRDPVHERVIACRRGETPDDLLRRGDKHAPVRPLDPGWQPPSSSTAATEPELWSQRRIHQQLEAFTRGRTHWPPSTLSTAPAAAASTAKSRPAAAAASGPSASDCATAPAPPAAAWSTSSTPSGAAPTSASHIPLAEQARKVQLMCDTPGH